MASSENQIFNSIRDYKNMFLWMFELWEYVGYFNLVSIKNEYNDLGINKNRKNKCHIFLPRNFIN